MRNGVIVLAGIAVVVLVRVADAGPTTDITVTEPNGFGDTVGEGSDFGLNLLGDRWDMANAEDVVSAESSQLGEVQIADGVFSGVIQGAEPHFYLIYQGLPGTVLTLNRGHLFPITPSDYRYLAARVRYTLADGGVLSAAQSASVTFYRDENSLADAGVDDHTFGCSAPVDLAPEEWQIVIIDLWSSRCANKPSGWLDFSAVRGLRVNPTESVGAVGVRFEYDWIRLVPEGGPMQKKTVTWTGGTAPYTVEGRRRTGHGRSFGAGR